MVHTRSALKRQLREEEKLLEIAKESGMPFTTVMQIRKRIMQTVNQMSHLNHPKRKVPPRFVSQFTKRK